MFAMLYVQQLAPPLGSQRTVLLLLRLILTSVCVKRNNGRKQSPRTPDVVLRVAVPVGDVLSLLLQVLKPLANFGQFLFTALLCDESVVRFGNVSPCAEVEVFAMLLND